MNLSEPLLQWYDMNRRTLPWRDVGDPYRIWISEIMLQQTRAETVIRYYTRFLERFPDVFALAKAPIDDVLKLWEGLGYYSRARNLHKCAKAVADNGGTFPRTQVELQKLPGIGPYVSRAIASIAYNEPVPALDGNQMRVLSRVFGIDRILKTPFDLEAEALEAISPDRPGDYNQALMDLGSSICTPKSPECEKCPLKYQCEAWKTGEPERFPVKPAPVPKRDIYLTVLIIRSPQGIAVRRRTEKLLGGLYEFPTIEGHVTEAEVTAFLREHGVSPLARPVPLRPAKHVFTHLIWHMIGYEVRVDQIPGEWTTADRAEMSRLAFPSAVRVYREISEDIISQV